MKKRKTNLRLLALGLLLILAFALTGCSDHDFDSYRPITDVNNLEGRKIGVNLAWSADYLLSGRDDMILYRYDETADMLMALCYRQLDAVAVDYIAGTYIQAYTTGLNRVEQELSTEGYILLFGNEERHIEIRDEFNAWLAEYMQTEEYAAWKQRLLDFDGGNYEPQNLEKTGTGSTIYCATYLDNYPLTYEDSHGNQMGLDLELMIAFANATNHQLEVTMTSETDMAAGMHSGKYDIIFSYISELYKEDYIYDGYYVSEPYVYLPIYILEVSDPDNLGLTGFLDVYTEE